MGPHAALFRHIFATASIAKTQGRARRFSPTRCRWLGSVKGIKPLLCPESDNTSSNTKLRLGCQVVPPTFAAEMGLAVTNTWHQPAVSFVRGYADTVSSSFFLLHTFSDRGAWERDCSSQLSVTRSPGGYYREDHHNHSVGPQRRNRERASRRQGSDEDSERGRPAAVRLSPLHPSARTHETRSRHLEPPRTNVSTREVFAARETDGSQTPTTTREHARSRELDAPGAPRALPA